MLNEHFFFFSSMFRVLFLLSILLAITLTSVYIKPFTTVKSLSTRQFDSNFFSLSEVGGADWIIVLSLSLSLLHTPPLIATLPVRTMLTSKEG